MIKQKLNQLFFQMSSSSQFLSTDNIESSQRYSYRRDNSKEGIKYNPDIYILSHKFHRTKVESEELNVQNTLALDKIKNELQQMRFETQQLLVRTESIVTDLSDMDKERKYREFTGNWDQL